MRVSRVISERNRDAILKAVAEAPLGAQIELMVDPHSGAQRRLMWALLGEISAQHEHCGQKWDREAWKCAFLKMMGKKIDFMPSLDGDGVVAIGYKSSRLSKEEMSEMIERIYQFGAEHEVKFDDQAA